MRGHIADLPAAAPVVMLSEIDDITEGGTCHGHHQSTILILGSISAERAVLRDVLRSGQDRWILEASSATEAWTAIARHPVDLVVVDLPEEPCGVDFCRRLKTCRETRFVPVLLMTGGAGTESDAAWAESGADEILMRPVAARLVRTRVRAMLRHKALVDSLEEAETILFALAQAVERRDAHTGRHCQRLAAYSTALGRRVGLADGDLRSLHQGGYLHDIGKISVPDSVLFKPGPLNDAEWEIMRGHTVSGEAICRGMKSLAGALPIIRNHHERWDGSGYPRGLKGEEIPLVARFFAIVDVWDALCSDRPYRKKMPQQEVMNYLREKSGILFDPKLVDVFLSVVESEEK